MSNGNLNLVRGALVLGILVGLFWAVGSLLFPQQMHQALTKDPLTASAQASETFNGLFSLALAVAAFIALRDPWKNLGLIQALIAATVIVFLGGLYVGFVVNPTSEVPVIPLVTTILNLVIAVALLIGYPRTQVAT